MNTRPLRYNRRDTLAAWLMLTPFLIFFALFVVYPIIMNFYYSFTNYDLNRAKWVGLKNYRRLFKDTAFIMALKNTSIYALFSVLALTILGFLTASALNREIRGLRFIRTLMIFPYATSMTAVSMIWLMLLDPSTGLINKALRLMGLSGVDWLFTVRTALPCLIFVNIWKNIGYCMLIFLAGMQSVPVEIYEAATVDGAGRLRRIWHVTLPAIRWTFLMLLILNMGNLLAGGPVGSNFSQSRLIGNAFTYTKSYVLDLYSLEMGMNNMRYSFATAISLCNSAMSMILLLSANKITELLSGESLF